MNASSIKTVLVLAVLAGVAYAVYITLSKTPQSTAMQGSSEGWSSRPPKVEIPGVGSTAPPFSSGAAVPGVPPNWSQTPSPSTSLAPPFSPAPLAPPTSPSSASAPFSNTRLVDKNIGTGGAPGAMAATGSANDEVRKAFVALMETARAKLSKGQLAEVHLALSEWYGDSRLTLEENRQLSLLLSQLAGTVIYSRQHLLEPPYVVRPGDDLEKVARTYNVPWQLLAKINGIRNLNDIQPNQQLKVVRGPFNAIVDVARHELILMLDGRYAGRFLIGIGRDCPPADGRFVVRGKTMNPTCYDANHVEDPSKPLGSRWIDLGNGVGIHGTNHPQDLGRNEGRGVICLGDRDIEDIYDTLTVGSNSSNGSSVVIRR